MCTPDDVDKLHIIIAKKQITLIEAFNMADYAWHGIRASKERAVDDLEKFIMTENLPLYVKSWARMEWRELMI